MFQLTNCNEKEIIEPSSDVSQVDQFSGMLSFENEEELHSTLNELNQLSSEQLKSWNEKHKFTSLKEIFNTIMDAEWAINDFYEQSLKDNENAIIPEIPIHSKEYIDGIEKGYIRIVKEDDGEYIDFNIHEVNMSPVLNKMGMVKVGEQILQFTLDERKVFYNLRELTKANASISTDSIFIFRYNNHSTGEMLRTNSNTNTWNYYSLPGNGWHYDGSNRRFRAWIQGSSTVDDYRRLYVSNVLRIEGMKKNIWGNWGYRETYYASASLRWHWQYTANGVTKTDLQSSSMKSPLNWSYDYVNNASINLDPHTSGYYQLSSGGSQYHNGELVPGLDSYTPVSVDLSGSVYIHNKSMVLTRY